MNKDEFIALYEKMLNGAASPEEIQQINAFKDDFILKEDQQAFPDQATSRLTGKHIYQRLTSAMHPNRKIGFGVRWLTIAAAAVLLIVAGAFLWKNLAGSPELPNTENIAEIKEPVDHLPGTDKAMLVLEDGTVIELEKGKNDSMQVQGATVFNFAEGALVFSENSGPDASRVFTNKLVTPRGGQYQLVLPDGSRVWLNASSSITFPSAFAKENRKVQVTGEAYFEVAHRSSHPFIVETGEFDIEVLGTSFNTMNYDNEPTRQTTLVSGSIVLDIDNEKVKLKPGQMGSVYVKDDNFKYNRTIKEVDTDDVTAWKDGLFVFNNTPLKTIMNQLARWYDVEVEYAKIDFTGRSFTGKIHRSAKSSEVLQILKLSGINFRQEEKKIFIYQ